MWQVALHPLGLGASATFVLLALVGVPLVVGASYLFFLLFERPFLKSRRTPAASDVPVHVPSAGPPVMAPQVVLDPSV